MTCSSSASYHSSAWNAGAEPGSEHGARHHRCGGPPRRALEIIGVIVAFFWFWPLAVAYLVWRVAGRPKASEMRAFFEDNFSRFRETFSGGPAGGFGYGPGGTGNSAFEEYRRAELKRLEEERRRLDEEARAFASFVEDLKRAKDREEFDAFMAKRRAENNGSGV
ncbi:DUF2852 domain-containing protein [Microvirga flavescens]|uniref:DUF2852 domain-containing protein n=1 Tax=Microvirga flavescens TaxID=2249811 RepID=UPI000DD56B5D|nr:DUF2852 domain-containing protein [Microvirga flavescens]